MSDIQINTTVTRKDYKNLTFHLFKKRIKSRIVFIIIISLVTPYLFSIDNEGFNTDNYSLQAGLAFTMICAFYFIGTFIFLRFFDVSPSKNGSVLGEKTYTLTDQYFSEETSTNTNHIKWEGIENLEENKKSYFLFLDRVMVYIIPKRSFKNKEEQQQFKQVVTERIN